MTRQMHIPISRIGSSYYLFHGPHIAEARSKHGIPGLLTGTLPQASQQNVFYGLPLQLMPEEARLLCDIGVGYIVDDREHHRRCIQELEQDGRRKQQWLSTLDCIGTHITEEHNTQKEVEKQKAIGQLSEKARIKQEKRAKEKEAKIAAKQKQAADSIQESNAHSLPQDALSVAFEDVPPRDLPASAASQTHAASNATLQPAEHSEDSLTFGDFWSTNASSSKPPPPPDTAPSTTQPPTLASPTPAPTSSAKQESHTLTPTTSHPPLPTPTPSSHLPPTTPSYPLFKHLHDLGYFLSPGLRFGCQHMAYPGDPLRFHSHFMVVGREWDEEVELLSLIGVGRLGTGVKKGVLLGGMEEMEEGEGGEKGKGKGVRAFCLEWGGM